MSRVLVIVAMLASLPLIRTLRVASMDHYLGSETYEDIYYVPPAEWLPVFSLGHDQALADLIWLRALVYFGDEFFHRGEVQHVFRYGDAILILDPDFKEVYHWVAMAGMYRPVEVSIADVRTSVDFLQHGADRFPDDGKMNWDLASSMMFELAPRLPDDEAARVRADAAPYLEAAIEGGAAPPWVALQNTAALETVGRIEQAVTHLERVLTLTDDPDLRARMQAEIQRLRTGQAQIIDGATAPPTPADPE